MTSGQMFQALDNEGARIESLWTRTELWLLHCEFPSRLAEVYVHFMDALARWWFGCALYAPCKVETKVGEPKVAVTAETEYPFKQFAIERRDQKPLRTRDRQRFGQRISGRMECCPS